jgi:GNAT superfamily N-acetyltransferase
MVNSGVLKYRDSRPGDERGIFGLFQAVFHREIAPAFWRWRYLESPWGAGFSRVALDGDQVVGHFGAIPMQIQLKGKTFPAILPMTAMTFPGYTGRGIFTRLMSETYGAARERGFPLVYGFFNRNSYAANVRYGYHDVITMNPLVKQISRYRNTGPHPGRIATVVTFDGTFDRFWNRIKQDYNIVVPRTRELLNWRFVNDPVVDYTRFAFRDDSDEILGYVILKIYREGEITRGHIVDLMTVPDDNIARALINKAADHFQGNGVADLSCWIKEGSFPGRILEEEGFHREPGITNFAAMVLDKTRTELLPVEETSRWFLTMGDSDVY